MFGAHGLIYIFQSAIKQRIHVPVLKLKSKHHKRINTPAPAPPPAPAAVAILLLLVRLVNIFML